MIADGELEPVLLRHRRLYVAVRAASRRSIDFRPALVEPVGVRVGVHVDDLVVAEVHATREKRPHAAVVVGIEDLMREQNPAACRTAGEQSCPRFTLHTEPSFY